MYSKKKPLTASETNSLHVKSIFLLLFYVLLGVLIYLVHISVHTFIHSANGLHNAKNITHLT